MVHLRDIFVGLCNSLVSRFLHFSFNLLKIFRKKAKKSLLIVRLDAIGDYVLFRNFLKEIKESEKFKDYKVTLLGNEGWKDIALNCDGEHVDEFILIEKGFSVKLLFYRLKILFFIIKGNYGVCICPTFSRTYYSDLFVFASGAKERIGWVSNTNNISIERKKLTDSYYTTLFDNGDKVLFEFDRNKLFFEKLLEKRLNTSLSLNCAAINSNREKSLIPFKGKYCVLFCGAAVPSRRWGPANFAKIANFLIKKYNFNVVILGGKSDVSIGESVLSSIDKDLLKKNKIVNLCGHTSLIDMAKILSKSVLLVSNDTSAIHFAAAVGAKFVCISNGNTYGRFVPYPDWYSDKSRFVFPKEINDKINDFDYLYDHYGVCSNLDINSIIPSVVEKKIESLIGKRIL